MSSEKTASAMVRVVGVLIMLFGLFAALYLVLVVGVPQGLRDGIAPRLLFAIPETAFGAYITYLGYRIAFQHSRRAFERFCSDFVIFSVIALPWKMSVLALSLTVAGFVLAGLVLRQFLADYLFREDN